jgi:hypothetical protein
MVMLIESNLHGSNGLPLKAMMKGPGHAFIWATGCTDSAILPYQKHIFGDCYGLRVWDDGMMGWTAKAAIEVHTRLAEMAKAVRLVRLRLQHKGAFVAGSTISYSRRYL